MSNLYRSPENYRKPLRSNAGDRTDLIFVPQLTLLELPDKLLVGGACRRVE
jgi:hypothetical protein